MPVMDIHGSPIPASDEPVDSLLYFRLALLLSPTSFSQPIRFVIPSSPSPSPSSLAASRVSPIADPPQNNPQLLLPHPQLAFSGPPCRVFINNNSRIPIVSSIYCSLCEFFIYARIGIDEEICDPSLQLFLSSFPHLPTRYVSLSPPPCGFLSNCSKRLPL